MLLLCDGQEETLLPSKGPGSRITKAIVRQVKISQGRSESECMGHHDELIIIFAALFQIEAPQLVKSTEMEVKACSSQKHYQKRSGTVIV